MAEKSAALPARSFKYRHEVHDAVGSMFWERKAKPSRGGKHVLSS